MPRGRILDKEAISQSRKLSLLSNDTGRLIYTWLLAHLDREGRFSADPSIIKGKVFSRIKMTFKKIDNCLTEMAQVKLITLYKADGDRYLQFTKFKEYQTHLDREAPTKIPAPNKENIINSGVNPTKSDLVPLIQYNTTKLNTSEVNKNTYADFILMTPEEYQKLVNKYGEKNTKKFIEKLNNTKGANRKLIYTSDYYAILKWVVEAVVGEDKKKELEKDYREGVKKEKEWKKQKKEEVYEHKPMPKKIKEQIHKVLNIPDRDKLNKLKEDK